MSALVLAWLLFGSGIEAQDLKPQYPRKEFIAEALSGYGGAVQFNRATGPYALMSGRNALAFGAGLRYRIRFGEQQRSVVGFGLEYLRLPFTFTWETNAREVYGVDRISRLETYQAERMGLANVWSTFEYGLTTGKRPVFIQVGLGAGWSQLDFYPRFGGRSVQDPNDPSVRYNIYTMTAEHRNGWVYLLRAGIGKEWCLPNLNRLGFLIYGQWSGIDDFNSGTYLAYPGTTSESRGTWKQGLNYVGVKLHYAMSYGAPKLPKQLRDQ
jgi:hypothetical protein